MFVAAGTLLHPFSALQPRALESQNVCVCVCSRQGPRDTNYCRGGGSTVPPHPRSQRIKYLAQIFRKRLRCVQIFGLKRLGASAVACQKYIHDTRGRRWPRTAATSSCHTIHSFIRTQINLGSARNVYGLKRPARARSVTYTVSCGEHKCVSMANGKIVVDGLCEGDL